MDIFFWTHIQAAREKICKLKQSVTRINSGDYTVLLVHNEIMIVLVSIPPFPKVFRKYCVKKKCPNDKRKYIMTNIDTQETDYSVYCQSRKR